MTQDVDTAYRVTALIEDLHRTYAELRALVGPATDAVLHLPSATPYAFPDTQRDLSRMERVQRNHATERATILDAIPAQVAILDPTGVIVAVNQAWRSFSRNDDGSENTAKVGTNYIEQCLALRGSGRASSLRASIGINQVMSGRTDLFVMHYRHDAETQSRWYKMTVTPLESGGNRGVVCMLVDVSEHQRADARAADVQRRLERLVDQAPIGILVHQDFVPILANREFARMFGHTDPGDILALADWRELIDPADRGKLTDYAQARLAGEAVPAQYHLTAVQADGKKITLEILAFLIQWGKDAAICAMMTDVTAKLHMEEQLRTSQRLEALGQLTGGIAHDFNNLLTVILGSADLLSETLTDPALRNLAELTAKTAERGANLTKRLLAFARMQPLEPTLVDINQLLDTMEDLLHRALGGQTEIKVVQPFGLWRAVVDRGELENAILNLCINARDAMPNGGRLTIETANVILGEPDQSDSINGTAGPHIMIEVSDTGIGMDAATIKRAFDPFFTTKAVGMGSGLGLSRVYGFVKQSGGRILIYSELGIGTSVKLYFPRAPSEALSDGEEDLTPTLLALRPKGQVRILAVEDDSYVRRLITDQLTSLGYQVIAVGSATAALQALHGKIRFDLLFTDIIMPGGMNGRELADAVAEFLPDLPVLFTSGYSASAIIHHGQLDPGILLLQKPYRRQELARILHLALTGNPNDAGEPNRSDP